MDYLLSLDWVQVRCSGVVPPHVFGYDIEILPRESKFFRQVFQVVQYNEVIITGQQFPKFDCGRSTLVILKVQNRKLYEGNAKQILDTFCKMANLTITALTRLDVCADFVTFKGGYSPARFLRDFLAEKVKVKGKYKFSVFGYTGATLDRQTLTIGRLESPFYFRLYNKSKELAEKKDKPYIRNMWENLPRKYNEDVWRLEVKCTDEALTYYDEISGEIINLANIDYTQQDVLQRIFSVFLRQKYRFYTYTGKSRADREQCVTLFDTIPCAWHPYEDNTHSDTTKRDKWFAKMLYNLDKEMRLYKEGEEDLIIKDIATRYAVEHNLTEWLKDHDLADESRHYS